MKYVWHRDGSEVARIGSDSLWISDVTESDGGDYSVTISNEEGETTLSVGRVQVRSRTPLPVARGQAGTVTVEDFPQFDYWIRLPREYHRRPLPIIYVLHPNVTGFETFSQAASDLGMIVVVITASGNGIPHNAPVGSREGRMTTNFPV